MPFLIVRPTSTAQHVHDLEQNSVSVHTVKGGHIFREDRVVFSIGDIDVLAADF